MNLIIAPDWTLSLCEWEWGEREKSMGIYSPSTPHFPLALSRVLSLLFTHHGNSLFDYMFHSTLETLFFIFLFISLFLPSLARSTFSNPHTHTQTAGAGFKSLYVRTHCSSGAIGVPTFIYIHVVTRVRLSMLWFALMTYIPAAAAFTHSSRYIDSAYGERVNCIKTAHSRDSR